MTHHCKHCNFSSDNANTMNYHATNTGHPTQWDLRERTEDWIPKGYVQDDSNKCVSCGTDAYRRSWVTMSVFTIDGKTYCTDCVRAGKAEPHIQSRIKITDEEYLWLKSLCCRGRA